MIRRLSHFLLAAMLLVLAIAGDDGGAGRAAQGHRGAARPGRQARRRRFRCEDGRRSASSARCADPRVIKILNALENGDLYVTNDNKVVFAQQNGDNFDLFDPLSGDKLGSAASDAVDQIIVNNRLRGGHRRGARHASICSATTARRGSPRRSTLIKHPSPTSMPALEKALTAENDPDIRRDLTLALAGARLNPSDKKAQLGAIAELSGSTDPDIFKHPVGAARRAQPRSRRQTRGRKRARLDRRSACKSCGSA